MGEPFEPLMVKLTRERAVVIATTDEVERARQTFATKQWIRFPRMLDEQLLDWILRGIESGVFMEKLHGGVGVEECLALESPVQHALSMLVNDAALFGVVERIAGCGRIGCFKGRVYRLLPGGSHHDDWHNDLADPRHLLGMSLNLSAARYRGGQLLMRDATSRAVLATIDNVVPGDAILFRLCPKLQHRVSGVEGDKPKIAFAGWFQSEPRFRELLFGAYVEQERSAASTASRTRSSSAKRRG